MNTDVKPVPKVAAAGAGGAAAIVLVYVFNLLGVELTPEVAAAVTTLLAFAAGYLKKG